MKGEYMKNFCMIKNRKTAFTLAEVLITLAVIGVIAAITLPPLINKINDIQYTRARERVLSTLGEAGRLIAIEGNMNSASDAEDFVKNVLSKKIKIVKMCGTTPKNCGFSDAVTRLDDNTTVAIPNNISGLSGTNWFTEGNVKFSTSYAFVSADGFSVNLYYNPYCRILSLTEGDRMASDSICINAVYDMNGKRRPNKVGKDIGWVTVFGNNESVVALAPSFVPTTTFSSANFTNANSLCAEKGLTLPNWYELESASFNRNLLNSLTQDGGLWSGSSVQGSNLYSWTINPYRGIKNKGLNSQSLPFRCIKR